ncbi:MAG: endonuclease domain-containing protein [Actinomycetota bacterium]|nr:endonuclease domain-containing protein [Actinomycetota bacterium]
MSGSPGTWEQKLAAAVLWGGEGAAVYGAAAAALWGFPGSAPGPVEIALPRGRRRRQGIVVRRVRIDPIDLRRSDGLVVTDPGRTLLDVADRVGLGSFDAAFHHCLHSRLTTIEALRRLADRECGPGRAGSARFRAALSAYVPGDRPAASPLEARCARLLARSGLPRAARQHEVWVAGRRRVLDFAWPEARVALEVDGYRWHSSRAAWENDRQRLRELGRAGWTIVHATHDDIKGRFEHVIDDLARLLAP